MIMTDQEIDVCVENYQNAVNKANEYMRNIPYYGNDGLSGLERINFHHSLLNKYLEESRMKN